MLSKATALLCIGFTHSLAFACPSQVTKGIDDSGTDYFDAKRAACLAKESAALKKSIFDAITKKPDRAWRLTNSLLCETDIKSRQLVGQRIVNPLVVHSFDWREANGKRSAHVRSAKDVMEKGCAFSPSLERLSSSSIKVSYVPYSTGAYCGRAFVLKYIKNDWFIVQEHGGCD